MARAMLLALIAVSLSLGLGPAGRAQAADAPHVIIFGDDQHRDTLPRHSWVVEQVQQDLNTELSDRGLAVYDETTVTLDTHTQGRSRRGEAEIIDIARGIETPPIDVVVLFSIYANATEHTYTKKLSSRMTARLIDVRTGRHFGSFEVTSGRVMRVPVDCDHHCMLSRVSRSTRSLTRELGALLAERMRSSAVTVDDGGAAGQARLGWPTAYTLVFDGFTSDDMLEIEEYFVVFSGYRHHRPTHATQQRREYWYESRSPRGRLTRNFSKMLHHLQLPGHVRFADNTFTIEKAATTAQASGRWDDW